MTRTFLSDLAILTVGLASLRAQPPAILQGGIVNAASQMRPSLDGGALAPGMRFIIYGLRLAAPGAQTTVVFSSGNYRHELQLLDVSENKIEGIVRGDAPLGRIRVEVARGPDKSRLYEQQIVSSSVGIYRVNPASSLRPGGRVMLSVTGLGNERRPEILVGNQLVKGSGTRGPDGQDQIAFQIPQDILRGCAVPVAVRSGGHVSNFVSISIGTREHCTAQGEPLRQALIPGNNAAALLLVRATFLPPTRTQATVETELTTDQGAAVFLKMNQKGSSLLGSLPPAGACTAYTQNPSFSGVAPTSGLGLMLSAIEAQGLDAGPQVQVLSTRGSRVLPGSALSPGVYQADLGGEALRPGPSAPLFFNKSPVLIRGRGGKDVAAFQTHIRIPEEFDWSNRRELQTVNRSVGATVEWKASGAERAVMVLAFNTDAFDPASALTLCVAQPSRDRFTIPAVALANVPATQNVPGIPVNVMIVAAINWQLESEPSSRLQTLFGAGVRMFARNVQYR